MPRSRRPVSRTLHPAGRRRTGVDVETDLTHHTFLGGSYFWTTTHPHLTRRWCWNCGKCGNRHLCYPDRPFPQFAQFPQGGQDQRRAGRSDPPTGQACEHRLHPHPPLVISIWTERTRCENKRRTPITAAWHGTARRMRNPRPSSLRPECGGQRCDRACGGDLLATVRSLVVANNFLLAQNQALSAELDYAWRWISPGYTRSTNKRRMRTGDPD